ncbi:twin-arginine translocase TatA/TatE family subunit [Micavibrio aeruginosavorus]|uniref:Sec-independent protein translocase protein TatA n=1 Tax=Micavibrio aeruginosavorus EPB TaxID=349215 RepID=M4VW02_9BACT|nr:twin-arginine translocase TatA/TatE family subunit [Micavibrio aeruginosavorus]AGH97379.1 Twin-arginine translocation protein TatA [Micavibrio aeruginosavorus EPB]
MSIGIWQIGLIILVIVLLFGAGRVPRLMEDIGKGINSFKKGLKDGDDTPQKIEKKNDQDPS